MELSLCHPDYLRIIPFASNLNRLLKNIVWHHLMSTLLFNGGIEVIHKDFDGLCFPAKKVS
jgi:hypothetical protein